MANNRNQNLMPGTCTAGCGFFGNAQYDGMCSQCYKECVKRKQAAPADSADRSSPQNPASSNVVTESDVQKALAGARLPDTTPSVETATPTVTVPEIAQPEDGASSNSDPNSDSPGKTKKRNRCYTCKKKVGLTGFECRCGGLFCSIHRYSDKHMCQFDYKELGADHIRKNNPVVVGEKVQKL